MTKGLLEFICLGGLILDVFFASTGYGHADLEPEFAERIKNYTVAEGDTVELLCVVENLGSYRVAWIRVESQTILSIHTHVITRNYRITLQHQDHQHWNLRISDVREEDRGRYMCQINTVPMKKQVGYLDVVVPPKFIHNDRSSTEVLAREGTNVTLGCRVHGHPQPKVSWQREDGQPFATSQLNDKIPMSNYLGEELVLEKVSRLHMGTYLCTATNAVPPSVTRRITLYVHFPPMIWIPHQLIGVSYGGSVNLECMVEAFPKSINYWTREDGHLVVSGDKFAISNQENTYKMHMKLTIFSALKSDLGLYHCYAKNSIGSTEGAIRLYETIDRQRTTTIKTEYIDEDEAMSSQRALQIGFRNRKTDERLEMLDDSLSRERNSAKQPPPDQDKDKAKSTSEARKLQVTTIGLLCTIASIISIKFHIFIFT